MASSIAHVTIELVIEKQMARNYAALMRIGELAKDLRKTYPWSDEAKELCKMADYLKRHAVRTKTGK